MIWIVSENLFLLFKRHMTRDINYVSDAFPSKKEGVPNKMPKKGGFIVVKQRPMSSGDPHRQPPQPPTPPLLG